MKPAPLILALLLAAFPACASYSNLADERDAWKPRPVYLYPLAAASPAEAAPTGVAKVRAAPAGSAVPVPFSPARSESVLAAPSHFTPRGTAIAEGGLADGFTLAALEVTVWKRNPSILAGEWNSRAALQGFSQARDLDELLRSYSAFTGAGQETAMRYPGPGIPALRGRIVEVEVRMARADLEAARRDALTAARGSFWELAYNRRAQKVLAGMLVLLDRIVSSVSSRYQAGEAEVSDLADAEIARKKTAVEISTLRLEQDALEARLRQLAGLAPDAEVGAPGEADAGAAVPDLAALERSALSRRPELLRMRAEAEKMELMLQMGRRETYPGYSQNLSLTDNRYLSQSGPMPMEEPFPTAPSITDMRGRPLGAGYAVDAAYLRELAERLAALREEIRKEEAETLVMVREAWTSFDRARREDVLYARDVTALARLSAESALRSYEAGGKTLTRALSALNADLESSLARERKRADLGIARAELEAVSGGRWDR